MAPQSGMDAIQPLASSTKMKQHDSPSQGHDQNHKSQGRPLVSEMTDSNIHPDSYRRPNKLILCFDGTGNKFRGDDTDSNILKIFRMLDRTAGNQYHYYQPGIGTYVDTDTLSHTGFRQRLRSWYLKAKDSAIGSSFDDHVIGGYRFLMRYYFPGDEIYFFGFSRGAYIARFLAEMLDHVGLLSHGNEEMIFFAWKTFSQWQCRSSDPKRGGTSAGSREMFNFMKAFRETFSRPVRRIRFLGLFDTVNSVPRFEAMWMQRSKFPYTARSSALVIRHAVSIDERRAKFRQDLIYQQAKRRRQRHSQVFQTGRSGKYREKKASISGEDPDKVRGRFSERLEAGTEEAADRYRYRSPSRSRAPSATDGSHRESRVDGFSVTSYPHRTEDAGYESEDEVQDIDEVWFSGGHGDIGGGWETVSERKNASHVPLVWMVREAMRAGLEFDMEKVLALGCIGLRRHPNERDAQDASSSNHIPDIRVDGPSTPAVPGSGLSNTRATTGEEAEHHDFHQVVEKAHLAKIHDSLEFGCGLGKLTVLSWKMMEYLPFRRMDLQSDGSWRPIRWPLPCGEVRDIPSDARIHGSVVRRLQMDETYRPGNLIIGGGGRGRRTAPTSYGIGEWVCMAEQGNPVGEVWVRRDIVADQESRDRQAGKGPTPGPEV